jgi:hypothetical protein
MASNSACFTFNLSSPSSYLFPWTSFSNAISSARISSIFFNSSFYSIAYYSFSYIAATYFASKASFNPFCWLYKWRIYSYSSLNSFSFCCYISWKLFRFSSNCYFISAIDWLRNLNFSDYSDKRVLYFLFFSSRICIFSSN